MPTRTCFSATYALPTDCVSGEYRPAVCATRAASSRFRRLAWPRTAPVAARTWTLHRSRLYCVGAIVSADPAHPCARDHAFVRSFSQKGAAKLLADVGGGEDEVAFNARSSNSGG